MMLSLKNKLLLVLLLSVPLFGQQKKPGKLSLPCIAEWAKTANAELPKEDKEAFLDGPFSKTQLFIESRSVDVHITTNFPEAESFVLQGMTLLHGFWNLEAERSFRQALAIDPQLALAYWGLAMTNEQRAKRAEYFIKQASYKSAGTTELEQNLVEAYRRHFTQPNLKRLVHDLETLALAHPRAAEPKALLLRQLVLSVHRNKTSLDSHLAASFLAGQIPPDHPGLPLYQSLLWLTERPELSAKQAPALLRPLSEIPDGARYAGEAFQAAGKHEQALKAFKKAVEKDLALLGQSFEKPALAQSLASNYRAYIECLSGLGRLEEAFQAAENFMRLPRRAPDHPHFLHLPSSTYHTAMQTAAKILIDHGKWELLDELTEKLPLVENPGPDDLAERRYWKGIASVALKRSKQTQVIIAQLAKAGHPTARARMEDLETLVSGKFPEELPHHFDTTTLVRWIYLIQGKSKARDLCQILKEKGGKRFTDTVTFCEIHEAAGLLKEALYPVNRQFRNRLKQADASLNLEERLSSLAAKMPQPIDFNTEAGTPTISLPSPLPSAPTWELSNGLGGHVSLSDYREKPVLLIFYLGSGCLHCIEQLNAFYPRAIDYKKMGIPIVAISTDPAEKLGETLVAERKNANNFPFTILSNSRLDIFRAYRAFDEFDERPLHGTFLISPEGKVLWSTIGNEPFMEPVWLLEEAKRLSNGLQ